MDISELLREKVVKKLPMPESLEKVVDEVLEPPTEGQIQLMAKEVVCFVESQKNDPLLFTFEQLKRRAKEVTYGNHGVPSAVWTEEELCIMFIYADKAAHYKNKQGEAVLSMEQIMAAMRTPPHAGQFY